MGSIALPLRKSGGPVASWRPFSQRLIWNTKVPAVDSRGQQVGHGFEMFPLFSLKLLCRLLGPQSGPRRSLSASLVS